MLRILFFMWVLSLATFVQVQAQNQFDNGDFESVSCATDCTSPNKQMSCVDDWYDDYATPDDPLQKAFCLDDRVCSGQYSILLIQASGGGDNRVKTRNPLLGLDLNGGRAFIDLTTNVSVISGGTAVAPNVDNLGVRILGTNVGPGSVSLPADQTPLGFVHPEEINVCEALTAVLSPEAVDFEYLVFVSDPEAGGGHTGAGNYAVLDDVSYCGQGVNVSADCRTVTVTPENECNLKISETSVEVFDSGGFDVFFGTSYNGDPLTFSIDDPGDYLILVYHYMEDGSFVVFEIEETFTIDCCEFEASISELPECTTQGEPLVFYITLDQALSDQDITQLFMGSSNYTYISHNVIEQTTTTLIRVIATSNSCNCSGEPVIVGIRVAGCGDGAIFAISDPVPCCPRETCHFLNIEDWSADDCVVINGEVKRPFSIQIKSLFPVLDILVGSNSATCQTTVSDLQYQQTAPFGVYTITGFLSFDDPNCTSHALVTLIVETPVGCCAISQPFSFPEPCDVPEECTTNPPTVVNLPNGFPGYTYILTPELNFGDQVTVINHNSGQTSVLNVRFLICSSPPPPLPPQSCLGLQIYTPKVDCSPSDGVVPNIPFHFELIAGDCRWILTGDHCDLPTPPQELHDNQGQTRNGNGDDDQAYRPSNTRGGCIPIPNPPLTESCSLDIVIIADRSHSILSGESTDMQNAFTAYANSMVGTGNTLTFIGMGSPDDPAIVSPTTAYTPGDPAAHNNWIQNQLFSNRPSNSDSWSTGLLAAAPLQPDVVLLVTDGHNFSEAGESFATCTAANALQSAGARIFVIGQVRPNGDPLMTQAIWDHITGQFPIFSNMPSGTYDILYRDYRLMPNNDFSQLEDFMLETRTGMADVDVSNISPNDCVRSDFDISGTYELCPGVTAVGIELEFWEGHVLYASVPGILNNGSYSYSGTFSDMIAQGLPRGMWYDVFPVLILSDGTRIRGTDFLYGSDNDIYFQGLSDPEVFLNTDANDWTTSMTRFCAGSPMFYHGSDPLSTNHFSDIQRRPIGSSTWGEYRKVGWLWTSLDGYTGDLQSQYPGYFIAGYEYRLKIAAYSDDPETCTGWSEAIVIFDVVDCCEANYTLTGVPECLQDNEEFTVTVNFDRPISEGDIELVYSGNNLFTLTGSELIREGSTSRLLLTFEGGECSCAGNMLNFDVVGTGCQNLLVWEMTDPIPCCATICPGINVLGNESPQCQIINGEYVRPFNVIATINQPVIDIYPGPSDGNCDYEIRDFSYFQGGTVYTISGLLVFTDPTCTDRVLLNFRVETPEACCEIQLPVEFFGECPPITCLEETPQIQRVLTGNNPRMQIHTPGINFFEPVVVRDILTGQDYNLNVGKIRCGPYDPPFFGFLCQGLNVPIPNDIDCTGSDGIVPNIPYHFEIEYEGCLWTFTGNYCDWPINEGLIEGEEDEGDDEFFIGNGHEVKNIEARIYPNPLGAAGELNFDLGSWMDEVNSIELRDIYGRLMLQFQPPAGQSQFQYQLDARMQQGLYMVTFQMEDGRTESLRLIVGKH